MNIDPAIDIVLLALMAAIALTVVRMRDLFGIAMLFSMFSLLSAGVFTVLDAADVAFTEAAVGAGISTILMLATLTRTARRRSLGESAILPLLVVFVTGALLIFGTSDLPARRPGGPDPPTRGAAVHRGIAKEIGIPNIVTSVLASYRGYDTLGETTVIFTAGVAVIACWACGGVGAGGRETRNRLMLHHTVLRVVAKLLIPVILLFALYVQFHGDYSPGGGFQAGVIFAAGIILHALIFGLDATMEARAARVLKILSATGVLIYAGVGVDTMLLGGSSSTTTCSRLSRQRHSTSASSWSSWASASPWPRPCCCSITPSPGGSPAGDLPAALQLRDRHLPGDGGSSTSSSPGATWSRRSRDCRCSRPRCSSSTSAWAW